MFRGSALPNPQAQRPHPTTPSALFAKCIRSEEDAVLGNIAKLKMPSHAELRIELGNGLKGLSASLKEFTEHVRDEARGVWMWRPESAAAPRIALPALSRAEALEAAARALLTVKYEDDQDAHESRIAPGLLVLSAEGIALADTVNYWKDRLAQALKAMNGIEVEALINEETGERGPRPLREVALEGLHSRRLHYRQAVRRLVVLRESPAHLGTPDYASFSWSRCRTVRRTSREALIEELTARLASEPRRTQLLKRDLAVLQDLPAGEPLALVRKAPPTVRVNVRWPPRDGQSAVRASFSAVAPVVMLGEQLPQKFHPLPSEPEPPGARQARADTQLEDTQLLATVPAFRYLREYRKAKRAPPTQETNETLATGSS